MEIVYGKAGRHIPKARRAERVWPYLYGFEHIRGETYPEAEKLCRSGLLFDDIESDPTLKESMPEGFIRWCCFNLKDDLRNLSEELEEKENWWQITKARAEGQKLGEIGEWSHLTSERVRQICSLLVARTRQKGGRDFLARMAAVNGRTDCLTEEEMKVFLGRRSVILIYLLTCMLEDDPDWYYWPEAHAVVLEGGRESAERTGEYVRGLPDVIPKAEMPQFRESAERAGIPGALAEQVVIHTYADDGYNYHRGPILTQYVCEETMRTFFPDGIYIYDAQSLKLFREKAREKYGPNVPIPENDHAMTVLLNRISMLRNRGIYVPARKGILPEEMLDRIRSYMRDSGQVSYLHNTLYGVFREDLLRYGVDNRYYLQGILKLELGEGYTITRDYITTDETDRKLKDPVIRYIRDAGRMVTKEELGRVFHTSAYLAHNSALLDRSIINYFGQYMHVDNLALTAEDRERLHQELEELLRDGQLHETKELLRNLRRRQPLLVQKAHLEAPYPVFSLVSSLFGDAYVLNRPYMALPDSEGARQIREIKGVPGTRSRQHTSIPKHRIACGPEEILSAVAASGNRGVTIQELHGQYHVTRNYIADVCESPEVVRIGDRFLMAQNIQGLGEAKDIIYEIVEKELKEHGVVRRSRLDTLIREGAPALFRENPFEGSDASFFLTKYIFQKCRYRDADWYFHPHNRSISVNQSESSVTLIGQVTAYCRRVGRPVSLKELTERLGELGYNTENLKYNLHLCEDPFLFIYGPDTYVLAESLGITDAWIQACESSLRRLFRSRGKLIPIRQIEKAWLEAEMPPIPMGIEWNLYFLQQLCCFYAERIGARTVRALGISELGSLHAFLVPFDSELQTPVDAMRAWLTEKGFEGQALSAEQLTELMRKEKLVDEESGRRRRTSKALTRLSTSDDRIQRPE